MASAPSDPYVILGLTPAASEEELRTAYRRLVQRHHPDHNHGSHESALRFAEVQEAYAHVKLLRKQASAGTGAGASAGASASTSRPASSDPELDARLAAMEQELRAAREQREKAARAAAQEAARAAAKEADRARKAASAAQDASATQEAGATQDPSATQEGRASDEELGYYTTNDSFSKILDDFADQVSARFAEAHPPQDRKDQSQPRKPRSVADWIDELSSRLTGEPQRKKDG
jgi:curved DNA-binding protein CbpA